MIDMIKGREIMVLGMGRSGLAAVQLLAEHGASKIIVTDHRKSPDLETELAQLKRYPTVSVVTGRNPSEIPSNLSMIIKSPGVPPSLDIFKRAGELKMPVLSEVELAYGFIKAPIVGITGTNGKTTTTALITAMLKEAKFDPVIAAGNIGNPLSGQVGKVGPQGVFVVELSSFQLDDIVKFRPTVALFLNFAEDHLDYHGSIENYYQAKIRIFENQNAADYAVLNAGEASVASLKDRITARVLWFDRAIVTSGVGIKNDWITIFTDNGETIELCPCSEVSLPGSHNLENALGASAAAWAVGADPASIGTILRSFKAIEHRLEHVACYGGVDYVNDSKGTNPGATMKAILSYPGRDMILIAGGKDKGSDFSELAAVIKEKIKLLLLIGETGEKLANQVEQAGYKKYQRLSTMEEAVTTAGQEALPGEIVLLSPACASWDMFKDYEARGNLFKQLVHRIPDKTEFKGECSDRQ